MYNHLPLIPVSFHNEERIFFNADYVNLKRDQINRVNTMIIIYLIYQQIHIYNKIHVLLTTLSYMFRRLLCHFQGELHRVFKTVITM
jgi:hypothetical protein